MTPTIRSTTLANKNLKFPKKGDGNGLNLDHANIHVWSVDFLEHFHELFKEFRELISNEELGRAKRLYRANDFKRYLTGRMVLRILLGRYLKLNPSEFSFDSCNGKPCLTNSPLKFNLS